MGKVIFRYNKRSETSLYFMVILSVVIGFSIYGAIIYYSGIGKGPEYAPAYFRAHKDHAVYFIFGLIPLCLMIPAWIAAKLWGSEEKKGELHLHEEYAVLYYDNKEVRINKGELRMKLVTPRVSWYTLYVLRIPKKKIKLCSSVIEEKEKKKKKNQFFDTSLDFAMYKLMYYKKITKGEIKEEYRTTFYDLEIVGDITTPEIFENSPYYVDYDSVVIIPETPFVTCLIRERQNPIHVVGDLELDISGLRTEVFDETNLKNQTIIAIIELDEQIGLS